MGSVASASLSLETPSSINPILQRRNLLSSQQSFLIVGTIEFILIHWNECFLIVLDSTIDVPSNDLKCYFSPFGSSNSDISKTTEFFFLKSVSGCLFWMELF